MLVLGIETSSRVGSVALVENGRLLAQAYNDTPNTHSERLIRLIDEIFEKSSRTRNELSLVAVGRGPGAFTGLRIGLSLAQGIAIGLGVEAVGIGSLEAMSLGVPVETQGFRYTVLDAHRGELFWACYRENGDCVIEPSTVPRTKLLSALTDAQSAIVSARNASSVTKGYLLGAVIDELTPEEFDGSRLASLGLEVRRDVKTDYPSALSVAMAASQCRDRSPATPEYLRDADAIRPALPPCPLELPSS